MAQKFNIADYQDNDIIDHQTRSEICSPHMYHLLISGWSKDENEHVPGIDNENILHTLSSLPNGDGFINCLDYSLDPLIVSNKPTECDVEEELKKAIDACLKYFHYDINVALIYKYKEEEKKENEIAKKQYNYDYQKRIKTEDDLEKVISILKKIIINLRHNGTPKESKGSKTTCNEIQEYCLGPGIEKAHENVCENGNNKIKEIENEAINTLNKLREVFNNIKFEFPDGVLTEFSQLYYHPEHSFQLPILLRFKKLSHAELWNSKDWSSERIKVDTILNTPVLGYYTRDNEDGCKGPHIVLCPLNIKNAVTKAKGIIDEKLLYQIVLIHELAHARMDAKRTEDNMKSMFAHAMEESLANMLTLEWFKNNSDQSVFDSVKSFINSQEEIYKFGIYQFEAGVDWTKWRDCAKNMDGSLKVWFDTCFEGGTIRNIEREAVRDAYDLVFK